MANAIGKDGEEYSKCFIPFDDALESFYDSFEEVSVRPPFLNTDKDKFLYALVHEQWRLCVYVVRHEDRNQRFIVVRPDELDMRLFLDEISQKSKEDFCPRMHLDKPFVQNLLSTMDTERDKIVARVLLGIDRSRKELEIILSALMVVKYRGIWKRFVRWGCRLANSHGFALRLTILTTISRSHDFSLKFHDILKMSHEMEDLLF